MDAGDGLRQPARSDRYKSLVQFLLNIPSFRKMSPALVPGNPSSTKFAYVVRKKRVHVRDRYADRR